MRIEVRRCAWLLLAGLMVLATAADAGRLFRYRDGRGVMHIGTGLPPGQAQLGYEILDARTLKVLDVVEPAPSAEQQRAAAAAEAAAAAAEQVRRQELADRQSRDRMLLQTYADEAELVRLRDSKLDNFDLILRTIEGTIGHLRQNLAQMQATVAEHRQAGRPPPDSLLRALNQTAADLAAQEQAAERTRTEQSAVRARFAADLDRYRHLTGKFKTVAP